MKYIFFAVFFLPGMLFAANLKISEIMYDLPGSDQGGEWVEILNNDSLPIDLKTVRFFEGGSNHVLKSVRGETLLSGERAIIASDSDTFSIYAPSYSGMLFDSSFSLSNDGETIGLKDAAGETLDRVSYSSSMGANGDGATLQYMSGSWKALVATPGGETDGTRLPKVVKEVSAPKKATTAAPKKSSSVTAPTTKKKTVDSKVTQEDNSTDVAGLETKEKSFISTPTSGRLHANAALASGGDSYFWPALSSAIVLAVAGAWAFLGLKKHSGGREILLHDPAPDITIIE